MNANTPVAGFAVLPAQPARQRGVVLLFALMALVAMSVAGIAFMRSVDNAGIMAGNLAFSRASVSISDLGIERARETMMGLDADPRCANTGSCRAWASNPATHTCPTWPNFTATSRWYWANWQTFGDNFRDYDWANACAVRPTDVTSDLSGYRVSYIVHRMCQNDGNPVGNNCISGQIVLRAGNDASSIDYGSGGIVGDASTSQPYYRITIRVTGPRNVETYAVGWML
jgi:type IV pilus assembly protein PilX